MRCFPLVVVAALVTSLTAGPAEAGFFNVKADGSSDPALQSDSPATAGNSGCGERIGALGVGCGTTPIHETTWGELKGRYR